MDLSSLEMKRLLPAWMQEQDDDIAFASIVDRVAAEVAAKAPMLTVWDKIDQLPEDMLEELAWALDITWWDSEAPIETKRALVKSSDYVHSKLGTVAAMEIVAKAYLSDGDVLEWFEYEGAPHNFKIATGDLHALRQNQERLVDRLMQAKRHSSKLESILLLLYNELPLFWGLAHRESSRTQMVTNRQSMWTCFGTGYHIYERELVPMMPLRKKGSS